MLVCLLLAATLLLSLLSLFLLYRGSGRLLASGWPSLLSGAALGAFVYHYGTWVYLSVYLRYFFLVAAILLVLMRKKKKPGNARGKGWHLGAALVLLTATVMYYTGTGPVKGSADLAFPLQAGRYIVLQGGRGLPANVFHTGLRGAVYAMDLARLNRWGNRANAVFSQHLEDYAIFGDTVFSPGSGTILRAVSDNPDNIPPDRRRGPHNLNGVLLETPDYYVFLGHLKQNAVFVHAGQQVTTAQPLGLVGNSGFSLEPHLHLQVHSKKKPGVPWYRQPQLFPRFGGRAYLLFDIIDTKRQ